ncbi:hypothetical protein Tco_1254087 [Tanacetum coccineum]
MPILQIVLSSMRDGGGGVRLLEDEVMVVRSQWGDVVVVGRCWMVAGVMEASKAVVVRCVGVTWMVSRVSGETEELSGMSFYIKLL